MASFKNQHYVPKCYLRQFAVGGARASISLFNVDRRTCIESASVRHQCSGNYFYGEDLQLEKILQGMESRYDQAVKALVCSREPVTEGQKTVLKYFAFLQHSRTEAAARRSMEFISAITKDTEIGYRATLKEAVRQSLAVFADVMGLARDLKVCVVRNGSRVNFITSDDPSVLTNRWHALSRLTNGRGFGLSNAGAMFLMPLSPKLLCVAYDGDVYSISNVGGWVEVNNDRDVRAYNEHQYLNCVANVYFAPRDDAQRIESEFSSVASRRLSSRYHLTRAILDYEDGSGAHYKVVTDAELEGYEGRVLLHTAACRPFPSQWPSQIKFRSDRKIYSNGSGTGFVRKSALENGFVKGENYRRVRV